MSYESDDDDRLIEGSEPEPMNSEDLAILANFKELVQRLKTDVYNKTVRRTASNEDLKELQKYEVAIYSFGTQILKALYGIETSQQTLPKEIAAIVRREDLSTDARILIENEVRNQFIQFPYVRKINNTNM